jgi:hypothetical protein
LKLRNDLADRIDMKKLRASGEPTGAKLCAASHSISCASNAPGPADKGKGHKEPPEQLKHESNKTKQEQHPCSTRDDPFTLQDLDNDSDNLDPDNNDSDNLHDHCGTTGHIREVQLKGVPPNHFTGNHSHTLDFLSEFNMYMMINMGSAIEKHAFKKTSYFLLLIGGPKAQGWKNQMFKFSKTASKKPSILLYCMDVWDITKAEFKKAFLDYAKHKHTSNNLTKLHMKDSPVDEYIATFKDLAFRANSGLNKPEHSGCSGKDFLLN